MSAIELIAFDADDTLWHNERLYSTTQARFRDLLAHYHAPDWIDQRLLQTETRNLEHFGYGIKAFALSMIETAVELTEGRISGREIQVIIDLAREMLAARVELLEGVVDVLESLAPRYPLMLLTKGDLRDQEVKLARSGLTHFFQHIEIVSDKSRESYAALLKKYNVTPAGFWMIGNSLRSDIHPVLALGGRAVYIPYSETWAHEVAELPSAGRDGFFELVSITALPELIQKVSGENQASGPV